MGNTNTKVARPNASAMSVASGSSPNRTPPTNHNSGSSHHHHRSRESRESRQRRERRKKEQEGYAMIIDPKEMVDGGYLFPQGVYTGPQDFKVSVVRDLIVKRRLAPFYKGLEDYDPTMSDHDLLVAVGITPLGGSASDSASTTSNSKENDCAIEELAEGVDSFNMNISSNSNSKPGHQPSRRHSAMDRETRSVSNRSRAHTTSIIQEHSGESQKVKEREAQTIWLYRNTHECPICFLLYPRLNTTRCCGQEICTECFVQIKRHAPHPPHGEPSVPSAAPEASRDAMELVSEPACCPYCQMPNNGVMFVAPPFEWGIKSNSNGNGTTINNGTGGNGNGNGRRLSYSHTHEDVVTTDFIRPDWESKLASARRRLLRKNVAARALHMTSLLPNDSSSPSDSASNSQPASHSNSQVSLRGEGARNDFNELVELSRHMTAAQSRALEKRMLNDAIRESLR